MVKVVSTVNVGMTGGPAFGFQSQVPLVGSPVLAGETWDRGSRHLSSPTHPPVQFGLLASLCLRKGDGGCQLALRYQEAKARRFQKRLRGETALILALWEHKRELNSNVLAAGTPQSTIVSITKPFRRLPTLLGNRQAVPFQRGGN